MLNHLFKVSFTYPSFPGAHLVAYVAAFSSDMTKSCIVPKSFWERVRHWLHDSRFPWRFNSGSIRSSVSPFSYRLWHVNWAFTGVEKIGFEFQYPKACWTISITFPRRAFLAYSAFVVFFHCPLCFGTCGKRILFYLCQLYHYVMLYYHHFCRQLWARVYISHVQARSYCCPTLEDGERK